MHEVFFFKDSDCKLKTVQRNLRLVISLFEILKMKTRCNNKCQTYFYHSIVDTRGFHICIKCKDNINFGHNSSNLANKYSLTMLANLRAAYSSYIALAALPPKQRTHQTSFTPRWLPCGDGLQTCLPLIWIVVSL